MTDEIKLRVDIISGKDLAPKDRNGFSDPVSMNNVHQTQVVPKSLNPQWDDWFEYNIALDNVPTAIHFTCWDKDMFGKDYMGEAHIALNDNWEAGHIGYNDPQNKPIHLPLQNLSKQNEVVTGYLVVKVGLIDLENQFLEAKEWRDIWKRIHRLKISGSPTASPSDYDQSVQGSRTDGTFKSSVDLLGLTFLEIVSAQDLPPEKNASRTGIDMDPFVVVSFSKQTFRTRVIPNSLNPLWKERLYFAVKNVESNYSVKFTVYDWDKITNNDLIATVSVPIQNLIQMASSSTLRPKDAEDDMTPITLDLELKTSQKYDVKPKLFIKTRFVPYNLLRIQFWHALSKVYDSDENGVLNYVELTTMLSSIGSSLSQSSIEKFFTSRGKNPRTDELTFDELAAGLEAHLRESEKSTNRPADNNGEELDNEHIIFIKDCPICKRPELGKLPETEIITHIAICASTDWASVDKFLVGDFVTESQAQRKWLARIITKVGYGGYKIGANNANIIVQDRTTGELVEEKMPTYIKLGIRLLYRGVKPSGIEGNSTRRLLESLSYKQGKKFDDPTSVRDIKPFIDFHKLNVDEILDPLNSFKNFNEFFYRKLKPGARKLDSPNNPRVLVSPADCRMMAFPTIDEATNIWIKGQNFSIETLLGDAVAAQTFTGGSLGIFRLAPQDYHRFHIPVNGILSEPKPIAGAYYTVNPMAIRSELDVYGENKRTISYINSQQFGNVAFVAIGAMMVGSIILTSKPRSEVKRFDEHGYFAFGGSTVILLFQKGKMKWDVDILANSEQALETLVRVGMGVGLAAS
ncbi:7063_t:CDS:10 [Paraglomus brasilianum]|uniref:Phosphatidylserine decarboxylase proenzyme 2 n=1 Tax=Paraglomus brasilianum TaxID=144538 RepID=A0A9N8YTW8_9GLOM|nr:7063_t:CDS:10 [Paraglomus brasilianum]